MDYELEELLLYVNKYEEDLAERLEEKRRKKGGR